jgi:septum formation protein
VPVVLASASTARRDLLGRLLPDFEVVVAEVDEARADAADPQALATKLARAKARRVAALRPDALVIGADTVAVCDGAVLGKPADADEAARMLRQLTQTPHEVLTALCVVAPDGRERSTVARAEVHMHPMPERDIARHATSPGALERAGAYALAPSDPNVERVEGSVTAVMGLPLDELAEVLAELYPECAENA